MAQTQLEKIRARLIQEEDRKNGVQTRRNNNVDKTIYPFWDIPDNSNTTIRFLPDADPTNEFFWVERLMIELAFPGVKGQIGGKPVTIRVPCMEMYGEADPIITETRPWWEVDELKSKAAQYWKKRTFFYQGLVVKDGLNEDSPPENPIRRFNIGPQIHQIIKAYILDPEVQEMPTDYVTGVDFRITKTSKGKYSDYTTSNWARTSRALSESTIDIIDQYGLLNLRDFLPKKPTAEEQAVIIEMFHASVNEELFDEERWGKFYRPYGSNDDEATTSSPASTSAPVRSARVEPAVTAPVVDNITDDDDSPFGEPTVVESTPAPKADGTRSAEQILQLIRNRPS
jgi:hypothetical protein